ncbi:hypothetical protein ABE28_018915 [Peribacillus muralis]|uniref:Uncharacterized protein n=1 Tax=Peribacillus muralis TaxID=264697 RepID=A0A1B3XTC4_9BACI|nr:hypothetical protein ABE28_018915 [Peribacillus muralis]
MFSSSLLDFLYNLALNTHQMKTKERSVHFLEEFNNVLPIFLHIGNIARKTCNLLTVYDNIAFITVVEEGIR